MTAGDTVTTMLGSGLRFGEPQQSGPLTMVPVFHDGEAVPYRLFAGAVAEGVVLVEEVGGGSVPELQVVNHAGRPVLLLEGEVLGGLRQTRTLNTTVLVPAQATLTIPVSCVEAGRWGAARPMAREDLHASPRVRAAKNIGVQHEARRGVGYRSHQGEVWGAVDRHLSLHEVDSSTALYSEVHRRRAGAIDEITVPLRPAAGQRGVLALVGARPLALDVFDRPDTLAFLWRGLVGSYAADARVGLGGPGGGLAAEGVARVAALSGGVASTHAAVGLGEVVFLTAPGAVVSALVVGSSLVHLAALWAPEAAGAGMPSEGQQAGGRRSWFGEAR
ncbi:MAG: DUF6569 family protein [Actinomycetota bacterium]